MLTSPHEALHQIFREDHGLASRLFERLSKSSPPPFEDVTVLNTDLTSIKLVERRADTVLMLRGKVRGKDHILVCEAQLNIDKAKLRSWPHYVAYLHDKYGCDVDLLVVCQKQKTADWARNVIKIGRLKKRPTLRLNAWVLGPDNAPKITDADEALRDIYFATLCAITHAYTPAAEVILKALALAFNPLEAETRDVLYYFVASGLVESPARFVWRELMKDTETYSYAKDLADMYSPLAYEAGEADGKAEGTRKAKIEYILDILRVRGVPLSAHDAAKIKACTDEATLDLWHTRSVSATTIKDVFRD
ncbi:hypothetical protein [Actinomadura rupiterrae]|uniref:hypothetical protein n=1 Tax=Actinomadura rupiterrae TaxID=559627 RepID=UPI0020A382EE|nr:hypothetical protein [Actinomadura rupiterrae]MCP2336816.1 hypothetical protein [Actinomadura rupiterrae]